MLQGDLRLEAQQLPGLVDRGHAAAHVVLEGRHVLEARFAARADHLNRLVRPALEAGRWVLLDRFTDATYAYQGGGRQVSRDLIAALETLVQGKLRPDLTVLLDLPAAQGLQRSSTPAGSDRFENERLEFFERVRAAYLEQARREPERVRVIDATQPLERVSEEVAQCLETLM